VSLGFEIEAIDAPVIVTGIYDMTFTAANECTQLPTVAWQRMYRGAVGPNGRGRFSATISNIVPIDHAYFWAEVRAESPQTLRIQVVTEPAANGLVERIEPGMFLEITGSAELPLGAQSAAAAFDGTFAVCPAEVAVIPNSISLSDSANDVPVRQSPLCLDASIEVSPKNVTSRQP
jgi:hypothetical protein